MEKYPKTRGPDGTQVVVRMRDGGYAIRTLASVISAGQTSAIVKVALTIGPLKRWIRSAKFHDAAEMRKP